MKLKNEKGQAFILVLILLLLGGLIIAPLLSYMSTGLKAGMMYENKMMELYAADSGVEDALWKIKTEDESIPTFPEETINYVVPDINGMDVDVEVENIWVLYGLEEPHGGMLPHKDWVVVERSFPEGTYQVEVTYIGKGNAWLEKMGVWLPSKFAYIPESCSLYPENLWLEEPTTQSRGNGTILIWEPDKVQFEPGGLPKTQTFNLTPEEEPAWSLAWIRFKRHDIYLCWDGTLGLYKVTSVANNTTIISHVIKYGPEVFINTWEIQ